MDAYGDDFGSFAADVASVRHHIFSRLSNSDKPALADTVRLEVEKVIEIIGCSVQ